jgi:hypothetical protein
VMKIQEKVMKERWLPLGKRPLHGHYRGRDPKYRALPVLDKGVKTPVESDAEAPDRPTWRKGYFGG